MELAVIFFVAFLIGWFVTNVIKAIKLRLTRNQVQEELEFDRIIAMKIEQDAQGYFAYNMRNQAFVAQGATMEEVLENFKQRFPDKTGVVFDNDTTSVREISEYVGQQTKSLRFDKKVSYSGR